MAKNINVDFYRVSGTNGQLIQFDNIVRQINNTPNNENRNLNIRGVPFRLNQAQECPAHAGITAEMVRIRMDNLPARASLSGQIRPLELDDDEGVGEETAFLYHAPRRILAIQRNKMGVSAAQVAHYFAVKANLEGYIHFDPILEMDTMVRFAQVETVRKLEINIAGGQDGQILRDIGLGIGSTVDMIEQLGAPNVNISLSMGHNNGSMFTEPVKTVVTRLLQTVADDTSNITKLRLSGRAADEDSMPILDLLEDRMVEPVTADSVNRRLTYEARKAAVLQAWNNRQGELFQMFNVEAG